MRNKKQHTVPACYLENFTDAKGKIHVRREDQIYTSVPKAILTDNSFYTVKLEGGGATLAVEETLSQIEGDFAELYRAKISKHLPIEPSNKALMAVFLAAMLLRTRSHRAAISQMFGEMRDLIDEMMRVPPEKWPSSEAPSENSIPAEDFMKAGEDLDTYQAMMMMANLDKVANLFFNMKWCFSIAPSDSFFITSDTPVCTANPQMLKEHGSEGMKTIWMLAHEGAEITMPISSSVVLLAGWQLNFDCVYMPTSVELMEEYRFRSLRTAYREVVSPSREYLESLNFGNGPEAIPK